MTKLMNYLTEKKMVDEIGEFWVVTKPDESSKLEDIFFKSSVYNLVLQGRGELHPNDIVGVYKNEKKARKVALNLLR